MQKEENPKIPTGPASPLARTLLRRLKANMFRDAACARCVRPSERLHLQFPVVKQKVRRILRTELFGIVKHGKQLRHSENSEWLPACLGLLSANAHHMLGIEKTFFKSPRSLLAISHQLCAILHLTLYQLSLNLEVKGLQVEVEPGADGLDEALLERPVAEECCQLLLRSLFTAFDHQPLTSCELASHQTEEVVKSVNPRVLRLHQVNTKTTRASS